jgi:hypothetical protein
METPYLQYLIQRVTFFLQQFRQEVGQEMDLMNIMLFLLRVVQLHFLGHNLVASLVVQVVSLLTLHLQARQVVAIPMLWQQHVLQLQQLLNQ